MKAASVIILGGGYASLGAAKKLKEAGIQSIILEAGPAVGGLAACVGVGPALVEGAYHHIKPHETTLIELIQELGLGSQLKWVDTRMGFYTQGKFFSFSTPLDLIKFEPFSWIDKIRFGLGVLRTKYSPSESVDGLNAHDWVVKNWGTRVHDRMMGPMLQNKFGLPSGEISAAFLHGRIRGIAKTKSNAGSGECMGYLSGSLQTLTDRLENLVRSHAEIHLNCPVEGIEKHGNVFQVRTARGIFEAEQIINTLPLEVFEKLPKNFPFHSEVEYQSAVCGIFRVEEKLTDFYWTNIIDERIPFKVLVNQSKLDDYPGTVLYCGNYLRSTAELYQLPEAEIERRHLAGLRTMFGKVTLLDAKIFKARYATPIYDRHFAARTAELEQTVPGMTFAGNIKIYPNGRTLSNILKTGYEAADRVLAVSPLAV